jgi:nitrile hydratase accessory protein
MTVFHVAIPGDDDGPVFAEPWQARVFAVIVRLCQDGRYDWKAFQQRLIEEVGAADVTGYDITGYYEHWLAAAEKLLVAEGLVSAHELAARKAHVAAHRPHPTTAVPNPVAVDPGLTGDR